MDQMEKTMIDIVEILKRDEEVESTKIYGSTYISMLKGRNLIIYTYKKEIAEEIQSRIKEKYIEEQRTL